MSLAISFHFLCAQHVSDINISIIRSLRLSMFLAEACNMSFGVVGLEWYPCCRLTYTTPNQPHRNSNTHRTKNNTTNVVIQQNSHKFLMMYMLMSEICWAHKKWNKIASDIKLVFYSSTIRIQNVWRLRQVVDIGLQVATNCCSLANVKYIKRKECLPTKVCPRGQQISFVPWTLSAMSITDFTKFGPFVTATVTKCVSRWAATYMDWLPVEQASNCRSFTTSSTQDFFII